MGGLSDLRTLAESSCLGTGIDPETDNEIGGLGDSLYPNAVVGARSGPATGTVLSDENLKVRDCVNEMSEKRT